MPPFTLPPGAGRSEDRPLAPHAATDSGPAWSPDGRQIAFVSTRDGNNEIYVASLDGSAVIRPTNHSALDTNPVWSHGGTRIIFESDRDGNREIYVMNADGADERRLTDDPADDGFPACHQEAPPAQRGRGAAQAAPPAARGRH